MSSHSYTHICICVCGMIERCIKRYRWCVMAWSDVHAVSRQCTRCVMAMYTLCHGALTTYCLWSVIQCQSPFSISILNLLGLFSTEREKETQRTRTSIEIWDWRNDTRNAIGCSMMGLFNCSNHLQLFQSYISCTCIYDHSIYMHA